MKTRNAELLMAAVILARSTSFIVNKSSLNVMEPLNIVGVRCLLAFFILLLIFNKQIRKLSITTFIGGFIIGAIYTGVMAAEMIALKYTDTSRVAFLENAAIVFVPIAEVILRRTLPSARNILCSVLAIAGVGFLTLTNGLTGMGRGEAISIIAALLYTGAIIATDRFSKNADALLIGIVQVGTMGMLSIFFSRIFENPILPQDDTAWLSIIWLAVVCTSFGFTLQPMAQKYISSERSSMICALNPLGAGVLGALVFHERLGINGIIGAILIMAGVLLQREEKRL